MTVALRELGAEELDGWDAAAVDAPGGHVYQSRAWAAHRAGQDWEPRYVAAGDVRVLTLLRRRPAVGGAYARIPRGPVGGGTPWTGDGSGGFIGETLAAVGRRFADAGIDVVVADPEVAATDAAYRRAVDGAGFHRVEEIQPSRHRLALSIEGGDEASVLAGISKQTRQRIRQAERGGVTVVRRDGAPDAAGGPLTGAVRAAGDEAAALERFYAMLIATGERRAMDLKGSDDFTAWWGRALAAGHLVYLEARDGSPDGDVLGGLVLYRHGRRLSTAHSADVAEGRRSHPGTMHLLRWRAIQLALAEGRTEMDLAGVDVPGARRPPTPGEPTYGLYEHKRSFGAEWIELAGAQQLVARPWMHAARRLLSGAARTFRPGYGA
jgi:lipid II:glycine glycyltransferase (peptidoglycan interpeptide bridge formation enzyme)